MKLIYMLLLLLPFLGFSQTFTNSVGGGIPDGTGVTAPIPGPTVCFPVTVSGVGTINGTYGLSQVCMTITHSFVSDLVVFLVSPDGLRIPLVLNNGDDGVNFTNTCFNMSATNDITLALGSDAPFTGTWIPAEDLGFVNNGQNANGVWNLCAYDVGMGDIGTVLNYSVTFSNAPAPPTLCPSNNALASNRCDAATSICNKNTYCGITSTIYSNDTWPELTAAFTACSPTDGIQNNSFYKFVASATTASFNVDVQISTLGLGIQMLIYSGGCGSGAVTTVSCNPALTPGVTVVNATGLTVGTTYYIMIDFRNSATLGRDACFYEITPLTGVNVLDITPAMPTVCPSGNVTLTASGGGGTYSWSPATFLNTTTGATVISTPTTNTTYTVTGSAIAGLNCPTTKAVMVTITPAPAAPTVTTTAPSCTTPTGIIVVIAPSGATIQYAINAGTYQASNTFSGLAPGNYNVTVRNTATGCTSTATLAVISPVPTPPAAPTASTTIQPTCTTPTGTIVVTAPTGANFQYAVNAGAYQASTTFAGLIPGNYNVTVRNTTNGCTSTATVVVVNALPAGPAAPTASATIQPTCTTPTGTIVVSAPTGVNFQYALNAGAYQASTTFAGLIPANYNVTVRDLTTGCTSAATVVTINAVPAPPAAPTATATTQPTCAIPFGVITVTAPTGATLEYSINGTTYQSSTVFNGLSAASYNVTVRNTATGCVSAATVVTINPPAGAPAAPTATVTVPANCSLPTGTITVSAPLGLNFEYNINGGTYQASTVFAGLVPASYNLTTRNTITGCVSAVTVVTVNAPTGPVTPTATVTAQPTCTTPTGTITITIPTGVLFEYSVDGTTYQSSTTFSGLAPGNYNVTVRIVATTCVSTATVLTVNPIPVAPAAPTAAATTQPTCTTPTGTIVVSAPTGANFQYAVNGGTNQASTTFGGLVPGNYNVTVTNTTTGCTSAATIVSINGVPAAPAAPSASVTIQPSCSSPTGTIVVTAPTGANFQYAVNGGANQASTTFNGLVPANYNVTVTNITTGCVSPPITLTVNAAAATLAAPTVVTAQPTCIAPFGSIIISAPLGLAITYSINGIAYQALPLFTNMAPGSYNVTAKDAVTGCTSAPTVVTINAVPNKSPNPIADSPIDYCQNETSVALTATGTNLLWYSSATGGIPNPIAPTPTTTNTGTFTYYVTQTNLPNCESDRVPIIVLVNELPNVDAGLDRTIFAGQIIALNGAVSANAISYVWTPILVTDTLKPIVAPLLQTTYTLTATTIDGCERSDDVIIKVINELGFPNVFSPNGDGINDKWLITNSVQYPNIGVEIYNRYGQQIFKSTGYTKPWDGTYNGKPLAVGTYYYIVTTGLANKDLLKGSISIIR